MAVNNVNSAPRLYTFAEMGYTTQAPQNGAPVAPQAPANGDIADISGKKPKKKISKGVIAAVATVAVAALAAFGIAKSGKNTNEMFSGTPIKLFTRANFVQGFENLKGFVTRIPARISGLFHRGAEAGEELTGAFDDFE